MRDPRVRLAARVLPICITAFLTLTAGHARAQETDVDTVAPAGAQEEADPLIEKIESLIVEFRSAMDELQSLDADAEEATGADRAALQNAALDLRLNGVSFVQSLVDAVGELETRGDDGSGYRDQIDDFIPRVAASIHSQYGMVRANITALQTDLVEAGADAQSGIGQSIRREEEILLRFLSAGVDSVGWLEAFELEAGAQRSWIQEQLSRQARLLAGRMKLAESQLADVERRAESAIDDAALQAEAAVDQAALAASTAALSVVVPLMQTMEVPATRYQQMLIESTGEITADVFQQGVASRLLSRWISGVTESIAENGPTFVFQAILFAIVLAIFWSLSGLVRKLIEKAVSAPHLRFSNLLKRMIVSLASGLVKIVGVLVALSQLGIQVGPMVAGLGIAGFIVGFALQETLGNFAAGAMILLYRPFDVGDLVECAGGAVFGTVSHMSLVSTTILTVDNKTRVVPNGKIWGDVITNVTAQDVRRVDMIFGISYTDDIPHAEEVLWSILKDHSSVVGDPQPVVKLHELGDSSVNFVVRPWAKRDDYWDVYWDVTREVKMRFDREGISIPFPQRDVHFFPAGGDGSAEVKLDSPVTHGRTSRDGQDAPDAEDAS